MDVKKTGIFWGSGFGEPGGTPPPRIPRSTPRIEPLLRERSAKELIPRNESREVGLFNPLSPNIHIQILQTGLYTFP